MPKGNKTKEKTKKQDSFEATLWQAADKLRKNIDAGEYKHIVLGLIFLKYISDAFEDLHSKLVAGKGEYEGADPEDPNEYTAEKVFFVPPVARWKPISDNAKKTEILLDNGKKVDIGGYVDEAMEAIERRNPSLKGVLPKVYARQNLDPASLGGLIDLVGTIALGTEEAQSKDVLGQVYEYFLGQFALAEGKKGGQFYTPRSVVKLLVEMLEPYEGRVFDPCCGSGGMFIQSEKFIAAHQDHYKKKGKGVRNPADLISIYGQESNQTTWRLAKMNLAIRGIDSSNIKWNNEGSFQNDAHKDLKADFIIANPPFNDSDWSGDLLKDDARWKYGVPPAGNANYAWIQHFIYHMSPKGMAGFVLANSALSTTKNGQEDIRKNIITSDIINCIVVMPNQLFYNTQIPASLWFLSRTKPDYQKGKILVIDTRRMGHSVASDRIELSGEEINKIALLYLKWKQGGDASALNAPGFSKVVSLVEIESKGFNLSPNKYIDIPKIDEQQVFDINSFKKDAFEYVSQKEKTNKLLVSNLGKYGYNRLCELDFLAMKTSDLIAIGASLFYNWFVKFKVTEILRGEIDKERKYFKDFGEIPVNWNICELQSVCNVIDCLHSSKPDLTKNGKLLLEVYNIAQDGLINLDTKYSISDDDYEKWTKNIEVQEGDCVITNVGRIAAIGQIPVNYKFAIGRNITAIRPIPTKISPAYLLSYLLGSYMKTQIYRQTDIGTIMDSLNVKGIKPLKILMPTKPIREAFEEIARPLRHLVELSNSIG